MAFERTAGGGGGGSTPNNPVNPGNSGSSGFDQNAYLDAWRRREEEIRRAQERGNNWGDWTVPEESENNGGDYGWTVAPPTYEEVQPEQENQPEQIAAPKPKPKIEETEEVAPVDLNPLAPQEKEKPEEEIVINTPKPEQQPVDTGFLANVTDNSSDEWDEKMKQGQKQLEDIPNPANTPVTPQVSQSPGNAWGQLGQTIGNNFGQLGHSVAAGIGRQGQVASGLASQFGNTIANTAADAGNAIANGVNVRNQIAQEILSRAGNSIANGVSTRNEILRQLPNAIGTTVGGNLSNFYENLPTTLSNGRDYLERLVDQAIERINSGAETTEQVFADLGQAFKNGISNVSNGIDQRNQIYGQLGSMAIDNISNGISRRNAIAKELALNGIPNALNDLLTPDNVGGVRGNPEPQEFTENDVNAALDFMRTTMNIPEPSRDAALYLLNSGAVEIPGVGVSEAQTGTNQNNPTTPSVPSYQFVDPLDGATTATPNDSSSTDTPEKRRALYQQIYDNAISDGYTVEEANAKATEGLNNWIEYESPTKKLIDFTRGTNTPVDASTLPQNPYARNVYGYGKGVKSLGFTVPGPFYQPTNPLFPVSNAPFGYGPLGQSLATIGRFTIGAGKAAVNNLAELQRLQGQLINYGVDNTIGRLAKPESDQMAVQQILAQNGGASVPAEVGSYEAAVREYNKKNEYEERTKGTWGADINPFQNSSDYENSGLTKQEEKWFNPDGSVKVNENGRPVQSNSGTESSDTENPFRKPSGRELAELRADKRSGDKYGRVEDKYKELSKELDKMLPTVGSIEDIFANGSSGNPIYVDENGKSRSELTDGLSGKDLIIYNSLPDTYTHSEKVEFLDYFNDQIYRYVESEMKNNGYVDPEAYANQVEHILTHPEYYFDTYARKATSGNNPRENDIPAFDPETGDMNDVLMDIMNDERYMYEYETEKDKNGKTKLDANGNPIYKLDPSGNRIPVKVYDKDGNLMSYHEWRADSILHLFANTGASRADIPVGDGAGYRGVQIPDEVRKLLASSQYRAQGQGDKAETIRLTSSEYKRLANAFMDANPTLRVLVESGRLTLQDIENFFFKKIDFVKGGSGYGGGYYPRYGGGGGRGFYGGGYGGSYGGSSAKTTEQKQNRIYNIMKNWSF